MGWGYRQLKNEDVTNTTFLQTLSQPQSLELIWMKVEPKVADLVYTIAQAISQSTDLQQYNTTEEYQQSMFINGVNKLLGSLLNIE